MWLLGRNEEMIDLKDCLKCQITLLQDIVEQAKFSIHFIRLHAPWPLLCRYAEELNLRAPIQVRYLVFQNFWRDV